LFIDVCGGWVINAVAMLSRCCDGGALKPLKYEFQSCETGCDGAGPAGGVCICCCCDGAPMPYIRR
jgi:hypothetical protein